MGADSGRSSSRLPPGRIAERAARLVAGRAEIPQDRTPGEGLLWRACP